MKVPFINPAACKIDIADCISWSFAVKAGIQMKEKR